MDSFELRDIVNGILDNKLLDLTGIAKKAGVNRSYLSKVINSKERKIIGSVVKGKIERAFPQFFPKDNENNNTEKVVTQKAAAILSSEEILSVLTLAIQDQAKARADQTEILKIHAKWLERIDGKMAQESTQASLVETIKKIDANLTETLTGVEFVSGRQLQKILAALAEIRAQRKAPSRGVRKKSDETNGDGHKSGIKP